MAESSVAVSHDIREAALNLNAKAFQLRTTLAAVWDFNTGRVQSLAPESAESFGAVNPGAESVVGTDDRKKVDKAHYAPGGKYRCQWIFHITFQAPEVANSTFQQS